MNQITRMNEIATRVCWLLTALFVFQFLLSTNVAAQTFSLVYQFKPGPGGINPAAGVVFDAAGNLYGTTYNDGNFASGTVFGINSAGLEKVLYSFRGNVIDGAFPDFGTLAIDSANNVYGTTGLGAIHDQFCVYGCGNVFKVDKSGKETIFHTFTGADGDGGNPQQGLVLDSSGNLYGITPFSGDSGSGNVFKITPSGTETVVYTFTGGSDGGIPVGGLLIDTQDNLYGTTLSGGSFSGVVFKIDSAGNETVLYTFSGGADGNFPQAGLIRDSAGNLYGTTSLGGAAGYGTIFKVTPQGQEAVLYSFLGGVDGATPVHGSLVRDPSGNLYGTTPSGGKSNLGVVFRIDPSGHETVLHNFSGPDGKLPYGTLVIHGAALYGTTYAGGAYGGGVVFKITR